MARRCRPLVAGFGADQWDLRRDIGAPADRKAARSVPSAPSRAVDHHTTRERRGLVALLGRFEFPRRSRCRRGWGLALTSGGRGVSRLGGRPDLPDGMPWPVSESRPLTHLATIDLSELPAVDGRAQLPADGTVVFFADFSEDGAAARPSRVDSGHGRRPRPCQRAAYGLGRAWLGFMFLDGGDITFHGLPEDVAAGRWDRLHVTTESC